MNWTAARRSALAAGVVGGLWALANPAQAQFEKYGHFNQNATEFDDVCANDEGAFGCGPIALMNSLVFLQNTHEGLGNLIGDDPHATAVKLSEYMGCTPCNGTDTTKFFEGKKKYLEEVAAGKIASRRYANPIAAELTKELDRQADVELFIGYYTGGVFGGGHYVTLYKLADGKLSFVDPSGDVAGATEGALDVSVDFAFNTKLKQVVLSGYRGTPKGAEARIDFAFAESPKGIPEPAAWAVMLLGFGVLGASLRRARAARA